MGEVEKEKKEAIEDTNFTIKDCVESINFLGKTKEI